MANLSLPSANKTASPAPTSTLKSASNAPMDSSSAKETVFNALQTALPAKPTARAPASHATPTGSLALAHASTVTLIA
jgi:hypothetical protein